NTVRRDNDVTAHPELKLARWAARELDPDTAARTTMYTSCQPCGMCSGAIDRSGLGRVVFALSTEQWTQLNPGFVWPSVPSDGPALFDEARIPIDRYHPPRPPSGPGGEGGCPVLQARASARGICGRWWAELVDRTQGRPRRRARNGGLPAGRRGSGFGASGNLGL